MSSQLTVHMLTFQSHFKVFADGAFCGPMFNLGQLFLLKEF